MNMGSDRRYQEILDSSGLFNPSWLRIDQKDCAPLPAPEGVDSSTLACLARGFAAIRCSSVLTGSVRKVDPDDIRVEVSPPTAIERLPQRIAELGDDALIAAPDLSAAVVTDSLGYVLVAGTEQFMASVVPNVEWAREDFEHYAGHSLKKSPRKLLEVALRYAPRRRSWRTLSEIPPGSATSENIRLLEIVSQGNIEREYFARQWFETSRRALREKDSPSRAVQHLLDLVSRELENRYPIESTLQEEAGMPGEELKSFARYILTELHKL